MSWSYRIATVRGISLKVHATFAFIVFVAAANWASLGWAGMAFGVGLILLLFACVTLHEFGHAFAAQYYGIPVREIVLLPIGGIAFLGRAARHPVQELVIAAAGPAVNVAIVMLLLPVLLLLGEPLTLTPGLIRPEGAVPSASMALQWLVGANVGLVLFNMIPAFPLDGGRILRGLLGLAMDWSRATRFATATGQGLAMAMGTWGLMSGHIMLLLMAALIFMSASATAAEERGHSILSSHRVGDACNRHALVLGEHERVSTVTGYLLTSYQPDFAVVRGASLLGIVRRSQVIHALATRSGDIPVSAIMTDCPRVDARLSLAEVRQALAEVGSSLAAVYDRQVFIGLVSLDDIDEAETILAFAPGSVTPATGIPGTRSRFEPAQA
ncbi:MAG: site-2 protease family protein [Vicinamibacterales bacterium]